MSSEPAADPEPADVHYPASDGEPMAETPVHARAMSYLWDALDLCLAGDPEVYVAGNMFLYYREGDPRACKAPDVYAVRGVPKDRRRDAYKLWEEGVAPQLVIEVTSRSTQREDLWEKRALYETLGIGEYLLFDPRGEYLEPRWQAYVLGEDGKYQAAELPPDEVYRSVTFAVGFRPEGELLRVLDADGEPVPLHEEAVRRAEEAEAELRHLRARLGEPSED